MGIGVRGFKLGHWHDPEGLTGCTVLLCPPGTVGGCDIRGSSPASRETALLQADRSMQEVHAVLLSGGSAYGLAAADGVMRFLGERGIGYPTPWGVVPIVPALGIFDLNIGDAKARPDSSAGYDACVQATEGNGVQGNVGAGIGASIGKWAGTRFRMKGGLGLASVRHGELEAGCIAVVNPVGDVVRADSTVLAGACDGEGNFLSMKDPYRTFAQRKVLPHSNTTLIVLCSNAKLSKVQVNRMAQRAHDGMARAICPVHTSFDGDAVIALASGGVEIDFDLLAEIGADLTAKAIRNAVTNAESLGNVRGLRSI